MWSTSHLTTAAIAQVFEEEVVGRGGAVTDCFDDGERLFARSLLPHVQEVQKDDDVQGGAAIRATEGEIWVRPYVFRKVCSNGAIIAQTLASVQQSGPICTSDLDAEEELRERISAACDREVFASSVRAIRSTVDANFDLALNLMPLLSRMPADIVQAVMEQYLEAGDRSRFGMMNAITATARITTDPERRWRLEELGGGVATDALPNWPPDELSAAAVPENACLA
jgi:hypothetical protein